MRSKIAFEVAFDRCREPFPARRLGRITGWCGVAELGIDNPDPDHFL